MQFNVFFYFFQLLLGIKDVDDNLVASTLVCLSELVPILGADTVIGGKRSKFFTDGRPKSNSVLIDTSNMHKDVRYTTKSLSDFRCSEVYNTGVPLMFEKTMALNERPTPVGGEAHDEDKNMEPSTSMLTDSEEEWGDWDNPNRQLTLESDKIDDIDIINSSISNIDIDKAKQMQKIEQSISVEKPLTDRSLLQKAAIEAKKHIIDISELDIKSTKIDFKRSVDEFDFFADMEPVIEKHNIATETDKLQDVSSKLNFVPAEDCDENEGWGENWN